MRMHNTTAALAAAIAITFAFSIASLANASSVLIRQFEHPPCVVTPPDAGAHHAQPPVEENLYPVHAHKGYPSVHRTYSSCMAMIGRARQTCGRSTRHIHSWHDAEFPECRKFFRAQVRNCVSHYDSEKLKCDALKGPQQRHAARKQNPQQAEDREERQKLQKSIDRINNDPDIPEENKVQMRRRLTKMLQASPEERRKLERQYEAEDRARMDREEREHREKMRRLARKTEDLRRAMWADRLKLLEKADLPEHVKERMRRFMIAFKDGSPEEREKALQEYRAEMQREEREARARRQTENSRKTQEFLEIFSAIVGGASAIIQQQRRAQQRQRSRRQQRGTICDSDGSNRARDGSCWLQ